MIYALRCAGCGWKDEVKCNVLDLDGQLCPKCGASRPILHQDYSKKFIVIPRFFHDTAETERHKQELQTALAKDPDRYEYIGPRRSGQEIQVGKPARIR